MGRAASGTVTWDNSKKRWKGRISVIGGRPWIDCPPEFPNNPRGEGRAREWIQERARVAKAEGHRIEDYDVKKRKPAVVKMGPDASGDDWFNAWEKARIARGLTSTADNRFHFTGHIKPAVKEKHVRDWTSDDVRAIVAWLDAKIASGDISAKYASNVWGTATKMCSDAVKSKVAELRVRLDNPATDVAGPESGEERAKQFLFPSEFLKLMTCEDVPLRWRRAVAIAIYLYPRAGEQRALPWTDIDLDHGMVHIHQAFERRKRTVGSTKSGRSRRFAIEPAILPLLRVMHAESGGKGEVALISNRMASRLRAWLLKAKITRKELTDENSATTRPLAWHDLRATGLTWCAVRGDDPMKIMQRAGHSDLSTTMIYVRTAEAIGQGFGDVFPPIPEALLEPDPDGESSGESSETLEDPSFFEKTRAGHGIRTRDIQLGKLALYQLS